MLVADQVSKARLLDIMAANGFRAIEITGFFNLVMVWNSGVSFGMFNSGAETTRWLLTGLAVAVAIGLAVWLRGLTKRLPVFAVGLVIGGALGNVVDRLQYGAVADFFDLHVAGWHWPAFNIADAAITVGVVLLLLDAIMTPRSPGKADRG